MNAFFSLFFRHTLLKYNSFKIFVIENELHSWKIATTLKRISIIWIEFLICIIHPLPTFYGLKTHESIFKADAYLSIPMFLRLYLICRSVLLHSKIFNSYSYRTIASLNKIKFDATLLYKILMTLYPVRVLITFSILLVLIAAWISRACET
jgi:hypothetical protein